MKPKKGKKWKWKDLRAVAQNDAQVLHFIAKAEFFASFFYFDTKFMIICIFNV